MSQILAFESLLIWVSHSRIQIQVVYLEDNLRKHQGGSEEVRQRRKGGQEGFISQRDSPDGSVIKTPYSNSGNAVPSLGWERSWERRSHMPQGQKEKEKRALYQITAW